MSPVHATLRTYTLTDDEVRKLGELAKPRLLVLSDQRTPQDLSNEFWQLLGQKYKFDWSTVRPNPASKDRGSIRAKPIK